MKHTIAIAAMAAFGGALIGYTAAQFAAPAPSFGRIACNAHRSVTVANIELDWRHAPDGEDITQQRLDLALRGLCGKRV